MKRKTVLFMIILLVALVIAPASVFCQTDKEMEQVRSWLGQWKRNFASPTFGATLFRARLDGKYVLNVPDSELEFPATAAEIRIFKGVNVSKRGGFYTGVETGLFFFKNINDVVFHEDDIGTMHLDYQGGLVFLMAKFGLRMDIGIALFGISLGGEIGIGGTMFAGEFTFSTDTAEYGELSQSYGNATANMSVILDTSVEGAIRLGKNFRLIAKAGIVGAPIDTSNNKQQYFYKYSSEDPSEIGWYWSGDPTGGPLTGRDKIWAILDNYQVEMDPFAIDLRVGFILNYN